MKKCGNLMKKVDYGLGVVYFVTNEQILPIEYLLGISDPFWSNFCDTYIKKLHFSKSDIFELPKNGGHLGFFEMVKKHVIWYHFSYSHTKNYQNCSNGSAENENYMKKYKMAASRPFWKMLKAIFGEICCA